jgi:hypothetical protein
VITVPPSSAPRSGSSRNSVIGVWMSMPALNGIVRSRPELWMLNWLVLVFCLR